MTGGKDLAARDQRSITSVWHSIREPSMNFAPLWGSELQTGEKELAGAQQYYEELKPGCPARFASNATEKSECHDWHLSWLVGRLAWRVVQLGRTGARVATWHDTVGAAKVLTFDNLSTFSQPKKDILASPKKEAVWWLQVAPVIMCKCQEREEQRKEELESLKKAMKIMSTASA